MHLGRRKSKQSALFRDWHHSRRCAKSRTRSRRTTRRSGTNTEDFYIFRDSRGAGTVPVRAILKTYCHGRQVHARLSLQLVLFHPPEVFAGEGFVKVRFDRGVEVAVGRARFQHDCDRYRLSGWTDEPLNIGRYRERVLPGGGRVNSARGFATG